MPANQRIVPKKTVFDRLVFSKVSIFDRLTVDRDAAAMNSAKNTQKMERARFQAARKEKPQAARVQNSKWDSKSRLVWVPKGSAEANRARPA